MRRGGRGNPGMREETPVASTVESAEGKQRQRQHRSRAQAFWFASRINLYALSLSLLWGPMNSVLMPLRVSQTVRGDIRGSALGLLSLLGIGIAVVVEPIAGRISDRANLTDRRRPFVVVGTALALPAIFVLWWAPGYLWLLAGYILLQLCLNVAQAAFQAYIPDLVVPAEVGLASGVNSALNILGSTLGLLVAGILLMTGAGVSIGAVLGLLGAGLVAGAVWVWIAVPRVPPLPRGERIGSMWRLLAPGPVAHTFADTLRDHPRFALATLARFLFLLGIYPLTRFLLYFLQDRFGMRHAPSQAAVFVLGATAFAGAGAIVSGWLSDRFGRIAVLRGCIVAGALGMLIVALAPTLTMAAVGGGLTALGTGAFLAASWALLGDLIPRGMGAHFYGVANIAMAGASALTGVFGFVLDAARGFAPGAAYALTFGLAALVTLTSFIPLRRIALSDKRESAVLSHTPRGN